MWLAPKETPGKAEEEVWEKREGDTIKINCHALHSAAGSQPLSSHGLQVSTPSV
jgi:hypothetical protein